MRRGLLLLPLTLLLAQVPPPGWKEFSIGPPTKNASRFNSREGLRAEGIPLRRAIAIAWGIPENRVAGPEWITNQRYAITAVISGEPETFRPLFHKELATRFHLEAHTEKRDTPVYLLKAIDDTSHRLRETSGAESRSERSAGSVNIVDGGVEDLALQLALMVNRPVIDETGISATRFDIKLTWDRNNPSTLPGAVKEQLGLQLVDAKRAIEFLVIDRAEQLN